MVGPFLSISHSLVSTGCLSAWVLGAFVTEVHMTFAYLSLVCLCLSLCMHAYVGEVCQEGSKASALLTDRAEDPEKGSHWKLRLHQGTVSVTTLCFPTLTTCHVSPQVRSPPLRMLNKTRVVLLSSDEGFKSRSQCPVLLKVTLSLP